MRISRRMSSVLGLALLVAMLVVPSALGAGPTVTVRVEGESATLLPATSVTLNAPEPVSNCPANSVAAAINLAVNGNWDHGEGIKGGDFTKTILGETHAFVHESDTWAEWVDYKWGGGICSDLLGNGDEVLMVADHEPEPFFAPNVLPLVVTGAPATVQTGTPFTVQVSEIHTPANAFAERGEGTPQPVQGATVSGAGATGVSGANGTATIVLTSPGDAVLRATKPADAPSASFVVCAHDGNDGRCGTSVPSPSSVAQTPTNDGSPKPTASAGTNAIIADLTGLIDGHRYGRAHAPRVLSGKVTAATFVTSIALRLRRTYRGRCWAYDGKRERFLAVRCRRGGYFQVASLGGDSFSYLLPARLPAGRYVLDIAATDAAGDHTKLVRGSSRIVFYVT